MLDNTGLFSVLTLCKKYFLKKQLANSDRHRFSRNNILLGENRCRSLLGLTLVSRLA